MAFTYSRCPICERPCELELCVVDKCGRVVHKACETKTVTTTIMIRNTYDEGEDLLQQARELRELADRLIAKSDALIATYRQLTERDKLPRAG